MLHQSVFIFANEFKKYTTKYILRVNNIASVMLTVDITQVLAFLAQTKLKLRSNKIDLKNDHTMYKKIFYSTDSQTVHCASQKIIYSLL